jgi:DNA repair exonuclease SbcCD ATPase subunit
MLWQRIQKRQKQQKLKSTTSRLGWFLFLVLLLVRSAPFSFADTSQVQTYKISEEDLKKLEDNLTELQNQFKAQEKIRLSLTTRLENANNELVSAKKSLNELESKVNSELKRKFWVGFGIGAGTVAILSLIIGLTVGLTK